MNETQPPLAIETEGIRIEPRKTGRRWLDLTVAFSAILISVISLFVAMRHGETQEKMLAATSWPILQFTMTNFQSQSQTIALQVSNNGVGPALVHYIVLRHEGRAVRDRDTLLRLCCAFAAPSTREEGVAFAASSSGGVNFILEAGSSISLFRLPENDVNRQLWNRLNSELDGFTAEACYCSVLGDCWRSDLRGLEPDPIESCGSRPADAYTG